MTNNEVNIKALLQVDTYIEEHVFDGEYTKTSQFLLPMVGLHLRMKLFNKFFVNAFLNDEEYNHEEVYSCPIFVLMKVKNYEDKDWQAVNSILEKHESHVDNYYVGEEDGCNLLMYVYDVKPTLKKDYMHFVLGRYSRFSATYKTAFPQFVLGKDGKQVESVAWGIVHKSPIMREHLIKKFNLDEQTANQMEEYYSVPTADREHFRKKKSDDAKIE